MTEACPINYVTVDEKIVRLNGFFSLILLVYGYFQPLILLYLLVDYYIRGFSPACSPITYLSRWVAEALKIKPKPVGSASKKFAAKIGFLFSLTLLVFLYLELYLPAFITFSLFAFAISLQTFYNYCIACKLYSILLDFKIINK